MKGAWAADDHLARGGVLGRAARAAVRGEGHPRRRRLADDLRLSAVRRARPRHRRPDRRAGTPGRRRTPREDQRAGVRGRVAHVQHRLRHHPQPGRPVAVGGRLQRRGRSRAGRRHGAARRRQRHGRLAAQPRLVLRCRRSASVARAGARVAAAQPVGDHVGRRSVGPQRRRPGAAAVRARRTRSALAARPGRPGLGVRAAPRRHPARATGGVVPGPRRVLRGRPRGGPGDRGGGRPDGPQRRPDVRGVARARARRRDVPDPARLALPGAVRRAPARAPRRVQAVARRQHPGG